MVVSCWLFLNKLYYDARIHEHHAAMLSDAWSLLSLSLRLLFFSSA